MRKGKESIASFVALSRTALTALFLLTAGILFLPAQGAAPEREAGTALLAGIERASVVQPRSFTGVLTAQDPDVGRAPGHSRAGTDERRYRDPVSGNLRHGNDEQGRAGLPGTFDPTDVVRTVQRNIARLTSHTPVPRLLEQTDEVGMAFQIGGDPICGPAAFHQEYPDVAFDGTNYFVVWEDHRGDSRDIYGARVTVSGTVLDSSGIAISTATDDQRSPAVAFDGANYLVAWEDNRSGSGWDIYGARVTVSGAVLDTNSIAISTATHDQQYPAVGFDGTNYLVAWDDLRSGVHDIYATRVDTSGAVLDPLDIPISTATGGQYAPAVGFDGTNYLVVWDDNRSGLYDIYAARVDTSGTVLDAAGIAVSTAAGDQWYPTVAFDGTSYLVAWDDHRDSSWDVYGARVDASGTVRDTAGIAISAAADNQYSPALAFDGENYFVVWDDDRGTSWDVYGTRVDTSGAVLDPAGIAISTATDNQYWSGIAFGQATYLVIWEDIRGASWDIYGARVATSGSVLDPDGVTISTTANSQLAPGMAFGGTTYLVAWEDERGDSAGIYGARVDASGTVLDAACIAISTAAGPQNDPAVAFDGTSYLVVWADYRSGFGDIYGARVDTSGAVLDPLGIAISTAASNQRDPTIAFDGGNYLVVWVDYRSGFSDIYGARVDASGLVLDAGGLIISTAAGSQGEPAVTFDGIDYLVVWQDERGTSSDIYGARVDTSGTLRDPAGIAVSTAGNDQSSPAIGFDGTNCLAVWEDERSGSSCDIYGARVDTSGAVLDAAGIAISTASGEQLYPAVAFSEMGYLVAWGDGRSGSGSDIYAARVDASGTLLDPAGVPISTAAHGQHKPTVASGPRCALLVAYECFSPAPYGAYRVWGNIWSGPTGLIFASASATAHSGYVTLSWQMGVNVAASNFLVERSRSPEGEFRTIDVLVSKGPGLSFSCNDYTVLAGGTYWYRIILVSSSGREVYGPIEVLAVPLPTEYRIHQSYPNPLNPTCTIRYEIPRAGRVVLRVFDVRGSVVRTLVDAWKDPGPYSEVWDGKGDDGRELSSGVYFYSLEAGKFLSSRKMVVTK